MWSETDFFLIKKERPKKLFFWSRKNRFARQGCNEMLEIALNKKTHLRFANGFFSIGIKSRLTLLLDFRDTDAMFAKIVLRLLRQQFGGRMLGLPSWCCQRLFDRS